MKIEHYEIDEMEFLEPEETEYTQEDEGIDCERGDTRLEPLLSLAEDLEDDRGSSPLEYKVVSYLCNIFLNKVIDLAELLKNSRNSKALSITQPPKSEKMSFCSWFNSKTRHHSQEISLNNPVKDIDLTLN